MIKYLIEKEFKQLLRNSFLPRLIFIFPCMIMLLMPWAANLEIKNIRMNIIDNDHSVISRRLVDKITASTYFQTTALPDSYEKGMEAIEAGTADLHRHTVAPGNLQGRTHVWNDPGQRLPGRYP